MHEPTPLYGSISALSAILDELDEGLLVVGPDNRVACVNRHLRHVLGIDRDASGGVDADQFVRRTLAPRIAEESCRAKLLEFFSGRPRPLDALCTVSTSGGEDDRVCCSCRAVESGPFRGMRVVRLSPGPPGLRGNSVSGTAGRKWIGEILRQNDDWYRFLVENLNEGIALVDREGVVVFANRRLAEILGCPAAEATGAPGSLFLDEEDAGYMRDYLQNPDRSSHEVFEIDLVRKDGARIRALVATTPVIDASGACRGFLAGVLNITQRKQMELQFEESEEEYRSLVELSAETTLIHLDGIITYINPAGVRLLGASSPGEVVGKTVFDFIHPESRDLIRSFTARDLQGEETPLIELPVVRLDGTTVLVEGRGTRALFAGRPAVQVVMRDITHRKQAEERLQASNRHLLLLNRIIGTSALAKTPDELLETVLNQALDLLGYDGGGVYLAEPGRGGIALRYEREMPGGCLERAGGFLKAPCAKALAAGVPHYLERGSDPDSPASRLLRDIGFAALACIPVIVESDVAGVLLIGSRDRQSFPPGERALLEAIGREIGAGILRGMLHQRLEAANREANLYLDILTHDIRNADNVANIYADLLIDELDGEAAKHARKLKDGIRKSIEITANVATIRKIHESRAGLAPVDLDAVIRNEIEHFPDLCVRYDGLPVEVFADDLLPQIFTNLIGNTAKHGGPGVRVAVAVESLDEGTVVVTVADTGPGIPDEMKGAILYRFERENGRRGSQGLGLSICRMLAARYGGRIWIEDRVAGHPEEGAAFRFTLRKAGGGRGA